MDRSPCGIAALASREETADRLGQFPNKPAIAVQSRVFCWTGPPGQAALEKGMMMKKDYRRVPTKFGPETRFEVRPNALGPCRERQEAELERLKGQLLAQRLEGRREPQLHSQLRVAANEAAALAWATQYPVLLFPALFEEKAAAALLRAERQRLILQRSRELLAA